MQELCFLTLERFQPDKLNEEVDAFWLEWELANADPEVLFERATRAAWLRSRDRFVDSTDGPDTADARLVLRARYLVADQDRRDNGRFYSRQAAAVKLQATLARGCVARIAHRWREESGTLCDEPAQRPLLEAARAERQGAARLAAASTAIQAHVRRGLALHTVGRRLATFEEKPLSAADALERRAPTLLERLINDGGGRRRADR